MRNLFLLLLICWLIAPQAYARSHRNLQNVLLANNDGGTPLSSMAEQEGYPDPKKAAELWELIRLDDDQRSEMTRISNQEQEQLTTINKQLQQKEQALSSAFASKQATEANIEPLVTEITNLRRQLAMVQLHARVKARAAMNSRQLDHYANLAGPIQQHLSERQQNSSAHVHRQ